MSRNIEVVEVVPARSVEEMLETALKTHSQKHKNFRCRDEPEVHSTSTDVGDEHSKTVMTGSATAEIVNGGFVPFKHSISFEINHGSSSESVADFTDLEVAATLEEVNE